MVVEVLLQQLLGLVVVLFDTELVVVVEIALSGVGVVFQL